MQTHWACLNTTAAEAAVKLYDNIGFRCNNMEGSFKQNS